MGEEWGKKSCLCGEDDTSLQCVLELGTWNLKLWCSWKSVRKSLGDKESGKKSDLLGGEGFPSLQ